MEQIMRSLADPDVRERLALELVAEVNEDRNEELRRTLEAFAVVPKTLVIDGLRVEEELVDELAKVSNAMRASRSQQGPPPRHRKNPTLA